MLVRRPLHFGSTTTASGPNRERKAADKLSRRLLALSLKANPKSRTSIRKNSGWLGSVHTLTSKEPLRHEPARAPRSGDLLPREDDSISQPPSPGYGSSLYARTILSTMKIALDRTAAGDALGVGNSETRDNRQQEVASVHSNDAAPRLWRAEKRFIP